MLAAVELADHASGVASKSRRRHDAADAWLCAGDDEPVAAVDALALLAGQFVGHLQRRFATGAINLHGNETPGLARERYGYGGEKVANAKRRTRRREAASNSVYTRQKFGKRVTPRAARLLDEHAADRQVVGVAGLMEVVSRIALVWSRDLFVGSGA